VSEVVHDRRHPLFEEKNTHSLKGGAWSLRVHSELALSLFAEYTRERPDIAATYPQALQGLCRVEARAVALDRWLEEHPITAGSSEGRMTVVKEWRLLEGRAESQRTKLGFDLAGDAQARRDKAVASVAEVDLAAMIERNRTRVIEQAAGRAEPDDIAAVEDGS
jgi:hypothetical protein